MDVAVVHYSIPPVLCTQQSTTRQGNLQDSGSTCGSPPRTEWWARTSCSMAGPRATAKAWGTSVTCRRNGQSTSTTQSARSSTPKTGHLAHRSRRPTSQGSPRPPRASFPRLPSTTTTATSPSRGGAWHVDGHLCGHVGGSLRLAAGGKGEGVPPLRAQPPAALRTGDSAHAPGPVPAAFRGLHAHPGTDGDGGAPKPAYRQGRGEPSEDRARALPPAPAYVLVLRIILAYMVSAVNYTSTHTTNRKMKWISKTDTLEDQTCNGPSTSST